MGQIAGKYDFLSRVNLKDLSTIPTPKAGEHILVSSNNSMNAAGQGNFDCYIVGDERTAATALVLHPLANGTVSYGNTEAINGNEAFSALNNVNNKTKTQADAQRDTGKYIYRDGTVKTTASYSIIQPIHVYKGDSITASLACYSDTAAIAISDSENPSVWTPAVMGLGDSVNSYTYTFETECYFTMSFNKNKTFTFTLSTKDVTSKFIAKTSLDSKIEDSDNAVKNSAVYNELYQKIDGVINTAETDNGFISNIGQFTPSSTGYRCTKPIKVFSGASLSATLACYSDTAAIAFSEDKDAVTWQIIELGKGNNSVSDYSAQFAQDGYVRLSYNSSLSFSFTLQTKIEVPVLEGLLSQQELDEYMNTGMQVSQITGFGTDGTVGRAFWENDMYYNTSTGLLRKKTSNTFVTIPFSETTFYHCLSDGKYYKYINNALVDKTEEFWKGIPNEFLVNLHKEELPYTYESAFINNSGAIVSSTSYGLSNAIQLTKGDTILVRAACYSDTAVIALADNESATTWKVIGGTNNSGVFEYLYTATSDCWFRCSFNLAYGLKIFRLSPTDLYEKNELVKPIGYNDIDTALSATNGYCYGKDGALQENATHSVTDAIKVGKGDIVTWSAICSSTYAALVFSTDNITWKCLMQGAFSGLYPYKIVSPDDGYIRISFISANGISNFAHLQYDKESILEKTSHAFKRFSNCHSFGTQPAANGTTGSFMNTADGYNELLSAVYEPLRSVNPNYITRTNIGKDATNTYDMYIYEFTPKYYTQSVILVGGVHADEPDGIACLARIMQLITNDYEGDDDLTFLRYNIKFVVIPCVNVWGYSQNPKVRTFSGGGRTQSWTTYPLAQELANLKPYLMRYAQSASFLLDMHTTTNNTYNDFYGVTNKFDVNLRTIFRTNSWLCEKYATGGRTVDDQYLGYLENSFGLLSIYFHDITGISSATLELSDYHWDNAKSTSNVITMGVTMWLNYIIQMINDFYKAETGIPISDYRESKS